MKTTSATHAGRPQQRAAKADTTRRAKDKKPPGSTSGTEDYGAREQGGGDSHADENEPKL